MLKKTTRPDLSLGNRFKLKVQINYNSIHMKGHMIVWITQACHGRGIEDGVNLLQLFRREKHLSSSQVLIQVFDTRCTGNGNDI